MKQGGTTESLCPVCLAELEAKVIENRDEIYIEKECPQHGRFKTRHAWQDPFLYRNFAKLSSIRKDTFTDCTLDVTPRCNMECPFCFGVENFEEPGLEEISNKASGREQGMALLYGGEPTLRDDIADITRTIKERGLGVNLVTNGLNLDEELVCELEKAGLDRVQMQFDSIDDDINRKLRGKSFTSEKLRAINNLNETKINLTFFTVVFKENLGEIVKIVSLMAQYVRNPTTTILSPVSPETNSSDFQVNHVGNGEIFERLKEEFGIDKEDFVECTKFDIFLSNFLSKFGINRRSPAPCEALVYIYRGRGRVEKITNLLDIEKLTEVLKGASEKESKGNALLSVFRGILSENIVKRYEIIPEVFLSATRFFARTFLGGEDGRNPMKDFFGIIVNPSQDRYNYDKRFIDNCNLESDFNGEYISFCERNIRKARGIKKDNLNKDKILE